MPQKYIVVIIMYNIPQWLKCKVNMTFRDHLELHFKVNCLLDDWFYGHFCAHGRLNGTEIVSWIT